MAGRGGGKVRECDFMIVFMIILHEGSPLGELRVPRGSATHEKAPPRVV